MNSYFYLQAMNNAWANHRIGQACQQLPAEAISCPRVGFFPSIIATLNHILIADWFYVSAFEGASIGLKAFESHVPCPEIADLIRAQAAVDQRFVAVCKDPSLSAGDRRIVMDRGAQTVVERFDRTFFHLIQHQIHHRGQVHAMLSGTDVKPPQLDEFYMGWQADQDLRAPDLAQLGSSEDEVWQGYQM